MKSCLQNISALFALLTFVSAGCNKVRFEEILAVVRQEIVLFDAAVVPGELQEIMDSHRVTLLGETYFVQEHQEFVNLLIDLPERDGLLFFNEFPNAYNWMVEDYVTGQVEHIPYYIRLHNQLWVERIREINLSHGPPYPVQFCFMDVNHNLDDFKNSISESEKILGEQQVFALIKILKVDGNAYYNELLSLKEKIEDPEGQFLEAWGSQWHARYLELISLEIESHLYRTSPDEGVREQIMYGIIGSRMQLHPGVRTMINCGMDHAQKETLMGTRIPRIGAMMEALFPGETCSIAFVGISGKRKYRDDETETMDFNILETAGEDDLIRIIGQEAGNNLALLKLQDRIFREEMDATYTAGAVRVAPGKQYDAIISYPVISVLKSLSDYNVK